MAITFNDNIYVSAGKPVDSRYLYTNGLPYSMTQEPPIAVRYLGMTILRWDQFGDISEWWYQYDTNTLFLKQTGGGGTSGTTYYFANGLTNLNDIVSLGGTIDQDTSLDINYKNFTITNDSADLGLLKYIKFLNKSSDAVDNEGLINILPNNITLQTTELGAGLDKYNVLQVKPTELALNIIDTEYNYISTLSIKPDLFSFLMDVNQDMKGIILSHNSMIVRDDISFKGLEYASDYKNYYTNRSLVDKQYVDDAIAAGGSGSSTTYSFSNGLTNLSNVVTLGGTITKDTTLTGAFNINLTTTDQLTKEIRLKAGIKELFFNHANALQYKADYSGFFNLRSLPDVEWVQDYITAYIAANPPIATFTCSNGITKNVSNIELGGTVTKNTVIQVDATHSFGIYANGDQSSGRFWMNGSLLDVYSKYRIDIGTAISQASSTLALNLYTLGNYQKAELTTSGNNAPITIATNSASVGSHINIKSTASYISMMSGTKEVRLTSTGLQYMVDNSASFTDLSLVNKAWVLAQSSNNITASNGLTRTSNDIAMGGTLTAANTLLSGSVALQTYGITLLGSSVGTNISFSASGTNGYVGLQGGTKSVKMRYDSALTYDGDYSASFLDNSLVTKSWVLANAGGVGSTVTASQGLTKVVSDIQLGGNITQNTTLNLTGGRTFSIYNDNAETGGLGSIYLETKEYDGSYYKSFVDIAQSNTRITTTTITGGNTLGTYVQVLPNNFMINNIDTTVNGSSYLSFTTDEFKVVIDEDQSETGFIIGRALSGILVRDYIGYKGLVYENDFSNNFTDRSIIDKGYLNKFIANPAASAPTTLAGKIYFNTTDKHFYGYTGTAWVRLDN